MMDKEILDLLKRTFGDIKINDITSVVVRWDMADDETIIEVTSRR